MIESCLIKSNPENKSEDSGNNQKANKRLGAFQNFFKDFVHSVFVWFQYYSLNTVCQPRCLVYYIGMKGYVTNIEQDSITNNNFRKVIYTAHYSQLVLMSLNPREDIGEEMHGIDQFIRVESGTGVAVLDGVEHTIADGSAIVIPAGTRHNIVNMSDSEPMKLYTIYSTPHHKDGVIHVTKADAQADHEEYLGKTSE